MAGGEDQEKCEALARNLGVGHIVEFLGYRPDVSADIEAADVFLLSSMEDPFPLVCVYAALHEVPVICFEDAGGMPEFTARGGGEAVPYGDISAVSQAVIGYSQDEEKRRRHGAKGTASPPPGAMNSISLRMPSL